MIEKDTIETRVVDKKEKIEETTEKIKDKTSDKVNEKFEDGKEKFEEKIEHGRIKAEDFGKNVDDIFRSLQKSFDEKFTEYKQSTVQSIKVDLLQDDEAYYVKVAVPGIDKDKINIEAGDKDISIECNFTPFSEEVESENIKSNISELQNGRCVRKINLEHEIDKENVNAKYENGIIYLTLKKIIEEKTKITFE